MRWRIPDRSRRPGWELASFRTKAPRPPVPPGIARKLASFCMRPLGSSWVGRSFGKLRTGSRPTPSGGQLALFRMMGSPNWVRFVHLPPRPSSPGPRPSRRSRELGSFRTFRPPGPWPTGANWLCLYNRPGRQPRQRCRLRPNGAMRELASFYRRLLHVQFAITRFPPSTCQLSSFSIRPEIGFVSHDRPARAGGGRFVPDPQPAIEKLGSFCTNPHHRGSEHTESKRSWSAARARL